MPDDKKITVADSGNEKEGLKKCPYCQKDISTKATKCPYCQSDLKFLTKCIKCHKEIPPKMQKCPHCGGNPKSWPPLRPVLIVVVIIIAFFIIGAILSGSGNNGSTPSYQPSQQDQLSSCLSQADQDYQKAWAENCKTSGVNTTGPNCKLPIALVTDLDLRHNSDRNDCYSQYPQK